MNAGQFEDILLGAISGKRDDIESILKMYMPLVDKNSWIKGKFDEDLRQYILMHIVKNISKFKI